MKLYKSKNLDCGFVILCTGCNAGQLKTTVNSINHNYPKAPYICAAPSDCSDIKAIRAICSVCIGGTTVTSLINAGMEKTTCKGWNFIIIGGTWLRLGIDKKYSYFVDSEKDILFPIVERKMNFIDGSINGILWHKSFYDLVGNMYNDNPLDVCKLMWATDALQKGAKFKGVVGSQVV